MKNLLITALLLISFTVRAADICVGASSSGNGSGSDWNNMAAWSSVSFTRGNTYWIADGSYGSKTFSTAASGTNRIKIRKATVAEHGTDTGWDNSYGDGQAVFTSPLRFATSFWDFDGVKRNDSNWKDADAYGFQINDSDKVQIYNNENPNVTNIWVNCVYLKGKNTALSNSGDEGRRHIFLEKWEPAGWYPNWRISSNYFRYGNVGIHARHAYGMTIEYNAFSDNLNNSENHGECLSGYTDGNDDFVIRFNQVSNYIGTAAWAVNTADDWQVYGNLYVDCEFGDGFIGFIGGSSSGFQIYNETVIRPKIYVRQASLGSSSVVKNCLFFMGALGTPTFSGVTVSYCGFSGSGTGSNAQTSMSTSIFEDYSGGDFRLAAATEAGEVLSAPFNTDMLGQTRGADGTFDRGAFEFNAGGDPEPEPEPEPPAVLINSLRVKTLKL